MNQDTRQRKYLKYKGLHERLNTAREAGFHFEVTWLAYVLLEDRLTVLVNMLNPDASQKIPLKAKIKRVRQALEYDVMLGSCFPLDTHLSDEPHCSVLLELMSWCEQRNHLMHGAASEHDPLETVLSSTPQTALEALHG